MSIQTLVSNSTVAISCHHTGGYRFEFPRIDNVMGTAYAAARCLESLDIEFEIDHSISGFVFVRIMSGEYQGFYDADFDYKTNVLRIIEDRG